MALRVLLLSSLLILISCSARRPAMVIQEGDPALQERQGKIWYKGDLLTADLLVKNVSDDSVWFISVENGKPDGVSKTFYPGNKLNELRYFENGKKEGTHRGWWEDGKPRFSYEFENDVNQGEIIEWYPSGNVARKFHYHQGVENGIQQAWKTDGTIKASYEVVNGRKYGNTGTKNCETVGNSH